MLAVGGHYLDPLKPECARMATGFSGGLANTRQELCGGLSGGVMVIGALLGRTGLDEDDKPAIELARRYRERFLERFGYTQCSALRDKVVDAPGGLGSCGALVEGAAGILMTLINESR